MLKLLNFVRTLLGKINILKIVAGQAFETGDFLNIFLRF